MKKRKSELAILLLALVLFSGSVSLLHGLIQENSAPAPLNTPKLGFDIVKKELILVSKVQKARRNDHKQVILRHLEPLAASESLNKMAKYLQPYAAKTIIPVLKAIKEGNGPRLSKELQQALILALAMKNTGMRSDLYQFLSKNYASEPLFVIALAHKYPDTINHVKVIFGKNSKEYKQFMNSSIDEAIARDDYKLLKRLTKYDISSVMVRGSDLLHQVVIENKDSAILSLLVEEFNADPNYSKDGKKTVLILAVEQNNEPLVKALMKAGADPTLKLDKAVGSAQDIAFKKGLIDIEALLFKVKP